MMDHNDPYIGDVTPSLQPCTVCGRTFRPDALERHEKVCKKAAAKKRKIFDSSKQRSEGTETKSVPPVVNKKEGKIKNKANWREKHEEFIRNIRVAKGDKTEEEDSPPKKNIPSDYTQCPSCERYFNQKAADRHISWCQNQKATMPKSSVSKEAKERLQARTKYKAPLPGKKGTEKTSTSKSAIRKTVVDEEHLVRDTGTSRVKSEIPNYHQSSTKSGKQHIGRTTSERDLVRSRESINSQGSSISQQQVVKFKEKFPNRTVKKSPDFDDSYASLSSHLQNILQTKTLDNRSPRTVPGVRTGGLESSGTWEKSNNTDVTNEDDYGIIQRLADLNSSISSTASIYGELNNSWNKKMFPSNHNLPEVSSCDGPSQKWPSRSCWGSSNNTPRSSGSSISSMSTGTSGSREGSSESVMPLFCSQCGSKYPISAAKYCCECGAKRRGFGTTGFKTELVSC